MSWRDTIAAQSASSRPFTGSLSGVAFLVPSHTLTGGRRTVVHELPQQDLPLIDDLGAKAKEFEIEVFADGNLSVDGNYLTARNALLAVLDAPGPMTLIHPWLGQLQVSQARPYRLQENNANGGRATFTLALVQNTGLTLTPVSATDTQSAVQVAATAVQVAANTSFSTGWSVAGMSSWGLAALESDLTNTLNNVESVVAGITNGVAAQIRAPYNMGAAIIGGIVRMAGNVSTMLGAFNLYRSLFGAGTDVAPTTALTPLKSQQLLASWSLHQLVRQTALSQAAVMSSQMSYTSSTDALTTLGLLLTAFDVMMLDVNPVTGLPIDDGVYAALDDLRAAVADDLRARGAQLPDITTFVPASTEPALVIAWRLYGDSSRADEIVARNNLASPGFAPGGQPLEVLNV